MKRCDPTVRAKCPDGKRCELYAVFADGSECDIFNEHALSRPMANADRIRAMSDEELAKILGDKCICPPTGECSRVSGNCIECWYEWLQQKVNEE